MGTRSDQKSQAIAEVVLGAVDCRSCQARWRLGGPAVRTLALNFKHVLRGLRRQRSVRQ